MKKANIQVGRRYTNGKGAVREVISQGSPTSASQIDNDCIRYRLVAKASVAHSQVEEREYNCTRRAFAEWAKEEVSQHQQEEAVPTPV